MSEPDMGESQNEQAEFFDWVGERLVLVATDLERADVESAGNGLRNVAEGIRQRAVDMEDTDQ